MDFTILATGSRGDVQPFLALAYGLRQRGHTVILITNSLFTHWAESYDIIVRPIDWDPIATLRALPDFANLKPWQWPAAIQKTDQLTQLIFERVQNQSWLACQDAKNLIYSILSPWGYSIAEKMGIPALPAALHIAHPTQDFPVQLPIPDLGGPLNYASHQIADLTLGMALTKPTNRFRTTVLGLPPIPHTETFISRLRSANSPLICNLSPTVVPRPSDWPSHIHMYGYWLLPALPSAQPDSALKRFLQDGPPPVYVGFGSMIGGARHTPADGFTNHLLHALQRAGLRAVVAGGWGRLDVERLAGDDQFFPLHSAPQDWLFNQVSAVLHHGGAGTSAAALLAGVPQIVIPHLQDQFWWAQRLEALGVSPPAIDRRSLENGRANGLRGGIATLAGRLRLVTSDLKLHQRAKELSTKIAAERGLELTLNVVEQRFAS